MALLGTRRAAAAAATVPGAKPSAAAAAAATAAAASPPASSLLPRLLSAAVLLPVLVLVCVWGPVPFVALTAVLAVLARFELTRAYARRGVRPNALLSLLGALLPAAALLLPPGPPEAPGGAATLPPAAPLSALLALACGLIAAALWETGAAARHGKRAKGGDIETGRNMAYGLLCGAYVSLFAGAALLRLFPWAPPPGASAPLFALTGRGGVGDGGAALVLATLAATMAGDSAAFFVGRVAGRHRLAEGLSPHKTTEGLGGGMAAAVLAGGAAGHLLLGDVGFGLVIGIAAAVLGPLGDLFKSALKREVGIKDFGSLIPGHGGVLDRFDSLLFTAPVVLVLARLW